VAKDAPARERLPLSVKLLFGAPTFAGAAMVIPIGIHMTKFYADVVLVPLGYLGIAIALARAFDAITDPLVGWLSDRTRSRLGRRRPWLLVGGPLCGVAFWFLFSPPADLSVAGGAAWFTVCYLAYFLVHTCYVIPHQALGAEITLDYHERSSLFGVREGFLVAGTLFAAVLTGVLTERMGERAALSTFAAAFGVLLALLYVLLVARVRERPEFATRAVNPFVPGVRRALRNRPFRILLGMALLASIPGAITATLVPFFNQYVVQPEDPHSWLMFLLTTYFGAAFLFLPGWLAVSRRVGKRRALMAALGVGTVGTAGIATVGPGDGERLLALLALAGSAFGALSFLVPAMKADVIDHDELHTGGRREAQFTSLWSIFPKFVQIPAAAVPIALLGSLGYVPNQPQTPQVVEALRLLFAGLPAACFALAMLATWRFPIHPETHRAILDAVAAHRRGETVRDPVGSRLLPPPGARTVTEETAWFLDHFSPGELARALRHGPGRLVTDVALAAAGSLALSLGTAAAVWSAVAGLDTRPGVAMVGGVVLAGFAFCGFVFHAVRLGAARRFRRRPPPRAVLEAHLAALRDGPQPARQPPGTQPETERDVGFP